MEKVVHGALKAKHGQWSVKDAADVSEWLVQHVGERALVSVRPVVFVIPLGHHARDERHDTAGIRRADKTAELQNTNYQLKCHQGRKVL